MLLREFHCWGTSAFESEYSGPQMWDPYCGEHDNNTGLAGELQVRLLRPNFIPYGSTHIHVPETCFISFVFMAS